MKIKNALTVVAAVAAAMFAQGTFAQASSPSRAEVKAEANSTAKTPAGQGATATEAAPKVDSSKTRAERKSETRNAKKVPAGEGPEATASAPVTKSNKTRAERKAETVRAIKSGETIPAGEGPTAIKK